MSLLKQLLVVTLAVAVVQCAIDEMQYSPARVRAARQTVEPGTLMSDQFVARIIGGTSIKPGSWPWLVWLGNCGGSLISPDWVLTASHCISSSITRQRVVMGTRNQNGQGGRTCGIKRAIKHPRFEIGSEMANDAALLQLDCSVQFSAALSPVMLPKSTDSLRVEGVTVFIGGWGTTSEGGSTSSIALEAQLKTISPQQCSRTYDGIDSTKMCAYGSGKDTCQGDSGGPLVTFDNARNGYVLYGVTSYGFGCGRTGVPGVYCHVPAVVDWVKQTAGITDNGGTTGGSVGGGGGSVTRPPTTGGGSSSGCDVQSGQTYKLLNVGKDVLVSTTMVVRSVGGGLYELENSANSQQVLTISNRVQQGNGERAVWSSRNGGSNQRYSLISNSDSTCSIKASHSGRYLDMGSGTGACGPSVCAWDSDGSQTQRWRFYSQNRDSSGSVTAPVAGGGSAKPSCGVSETGESSSYQLFNKGKNTNVESTFWLKETGTGAYEAVRTSDGQVLTEVSADQSTNGKQLSWVTDRNLPNQQFTLVSADDSYCHLQMVHSRKYLDMGSGTGACGTSICQWAGDNSVTQLWRFTRV